MEINGRQSCVRTIHAEENAIVTAAKFGIKLDGGTLYTTASTCYNCLKRVAQVGIKRVVYGTEYIGGASVDVGAVAKEHGIGMEYLPLAQALAQWEPAPPAVSIKR
jgi:dCMP deaminase